MVTNSPKRTTRPGPKREDKAYVLHRYDFSESSLILELFTRHHGRICVLAKGAKRPTSQFRPILLPLQPLHIAWNGLSEIKTLKAATWLGGHVMPVGSGLLEGLYLNELMMRVMAREDPHPLLFDELDSMIQSLGRYHPKTNENGHLILPTPHPTPTTYPTTPTPTPSTLPTLPTLPNPDKAAKLRAFELCLLKEAGVLPDLHWDTQNNLWLEPHQFYTLHPEWGLYAIPSDNHHAVAGYVWHSLAESLQQPHRLNAMMFDCQLALPQLTALLQRYLLHHSGQARFKSLEVVAGTTMIENHGFDG